MSLARSTLATFNKQNQTMNPLKPGEQPVITETNISTCQAPKKMSVEHLPVAVTTGGSLLDRIVNASRTIVNKTTKREVTVRFSINHQAWVEVNPEQVDEVIAVVGLPAYLENVDFRAAKVTTRIGCGSRSDIAGVAHGMLHSAVPDSAPKLGWSNLGFKDKFYTATNDDMTSAAHLSLSANRAAKVIE